MGSGLEDIFEGILPPSADPEKPVYAVMPVSGQGSYFVGRDSDARACLLIATREPTGRTHAPIRLESLDVQFDLRCRLKRKGEHEHEGTFTVIRCRVPDKETVRYFWSVCDTIIRLVGDLPSRSEVAAAVNRLVAIFQ